MTGGGVINIGGGILVVGFGIEVLSRAKKIFQHNTNLEDPQGEYLKNRIYDFINTVNFKKMLQNLRQMNF